MPASCIFSSAASSEFELFVDRVARTIARSCILTERVAQVKQRGQTFTRTHIFMKHNTRELTRSQANAHIYGYRSVGKLRTWTARSKRTTLRTSPAHQNREDSIRPSLYTIHNPVDFRCPRPRGPTVWNIRSPRVPDHRLSKILEMPPVSGVLEPHSLGLSLPESQRPSQKAAEPGDSERRSLSRDVSGGAGGSLMGNRRRH